MSSSEGSAAPVVDASSLPFKTSLTSVNTSTADILSQSPKSSLTSVEIPAVDASSLPFKSSLTSVNTSTADILSQSPKSSSTSVENPVVDESSPPFKTLSTSVDTPIADSLSRSSKKSSTSVADPVVDASSPPLNTSSPSVALSIADILSRSNQISSTSVETSVPDMSSTSFNNSVNTSTPGNMSRRSNNFTPPLIPLLSDSTYVPVNPERMPTGATSPRIPVLSRVSSTFVAYSTPGVYPVYLYQDSAGSRFLDACQILAIHWQLNIKQQRAVNTALHEHISLIGGPPQTGKTYIMSAMIWLMVMAGNRVLTCTPTKKALEPIIVNLILTNPQNFYPHLRRFPIVRLHCPGPKRNLSYELAFRMEMTLLAHARTDLRDLEQTLSGGSRESERRRLELMGYYTRPDYTLPEAIVLLAREDATRFESSHGTKDDADSCKAFRTILEQYSHEGPQSVSLTDQNLFHKQYMTMTARVLDRAHIVLATLKDSVCDDLAQFYIPDVVTIDQAGQDHEDLRVFGIITSAARRIVVVQ